MMDDPLLETLMKELDIAVEESKPTATPVVPPIAPVVEPPPVVATPPAAPAPPRTTVRKKTTAEDLQRTADLAAQSAVDRMRKQTPLPLPPKEEVIEVPPTPAPVVQGDEGLSADQQKELALARYAEKVEPTKYKGKAEALAAFYKKVEEYHTQHADDSDRTFDENDDEFVRFVREHKPKWKAGEVDALRERKISDETTERVRKEMNPELERLRQSAHEAKVMPIIERQLEEFERGLVGELKSEDPLESEIYTDTRGQFVKVADEYLRIANGLVQFNASDYRHDYLVGFVNYQAKVMKDQGGDAKIRNGKSFVHPVEFSQMVVSKSPDLAKHWTFSPQDVLKMLASDAKSNAQNRIKSEEELAVKRGFAKVKPVQPPKVETARPEPTQLGGPRVTATPSAGAANVTTEIDWSNHPGLEIIRTLGLDAK